MRTTSFAACCLLASVTTHVAFAADIPAKPEGDCALDKYAKTHYVDFTSEAGCGDTWKAWEAWCDEQYATGGDWEECKNVEDAWNEVNGDEFINSNLQLSRTSTTEGNSSSFFGADFAKGAAFGGLASLGAVYALSKCQQMRKGAVDEGFHRI